MKKVAMKVNHALNGLIDQKFPYHEHISCPLYTLPSDAHVHLVILKQAISTWTLVWCGLRPLVGTSFIASAQAWPQSWEELISTSTLFRHKSLRERNFWYRNSISHINAGWTVSNSWVMLPNRGISVSQRITCWGGVDRTFSKELANRLWVKYTFLGGLGECPPGNIWKLAAIGLILLGFGS